MASFTITRSIMIAADPATIRPHLVDFRAWQAWSPWEGMDSDLSRTYSGPESGPGTEYAWDGKKSGAGSMRISDATDDTVDIDLRFTRPWKATNQVTLGLVPNADGTEVSWTMRGENRGISALFAKVVSMDKMLGKDFEKGLSQLKKVVEAD